jgi:hypothetical protein
LNMGETELSVLSGQCLDRRIDELAVLRHEVGAWEDHRNRTEARVRWRFTTEDARIKLEKCRMSLIRLVDQRVGTR